MKKLEDKIRSYQHWPDRKKQGDKLLLFTESKEFVFFLANIIQNEQWEAPSEATTFLSVMDWGYKGYCACIHVFIQYVLHQKEDYQVIIAVLEHTTDKAIDVVMNDLYDNRYQMLKRIYTGYKGEKTFPLDLFEKFKVVPDDKLTFRLYDNDTAYEVEAYSTLTCGNVVIPATYNGKPVKKIARNAFSNTDVISVELPEGIVAIGESAFGGKIRTVKLPQSLATIGRCAFYCCLRGTIVIPKNVTIIEERAFELTDLINILVEGHTEKPDGWNDRWNSNQVAVVWDYKGEKE